MSPQVVIRPKGMVVRSLHVLNRSFGQIVLESPPICDLSDEAESLTVSYESLSLRRESGPRLLSLAVNQHSHCSRQSFQFREFYLDTATNELTTAEGNYHDLMVFSENAQELLNGLYLCYPLDEKNGLVS